MSKEEQKTQSCQCPFCDEPVCPDPVDGQYSCSIDGKLKIYQVDCLGLYCPVPVMRAKEEIDQLASGNLMELIADDPAAAEDIPRWAKRSGHLLVSTKQEGNELRFIIQKDKGEQDND